MLRRYPFYVAHRKQEERYRFATLDIDTMIGKGREVAAVMLARIEILCYPMMRLRWIGGKSGGKARDLSDGYKLHYCGGKTARNGVGICLSEYWQDKAIAVERTANWIIATKLVIHVPGLSINIASVHALQQGCSQEDTFWNQLDTF